MKIIPVKGMKKVPLYPDEFHMSLFVHLIQYLVAKDEIRERFQKETGKNITSLLNRSAMDKMIDSTTGYEADLIASFADWVAENFWGIEEPK